MPSSPNPTPKKAQVLAALDLLIRIMLSLVILIGLFLFLPFFIASWKAVLFVIVFCGISGLLAYFPSRSPSLRSPLRHSNQAPASQINKQALPSIFSFFRLNFAASQPSAQVDVQILEGGRLAMAHQIVDYWNDRTNKSWALVEKATVVAFSGKVQCLDAEGGAKIIEIDVSYDLFKHGKLSCIVRESPNNGISLIYEWSGSERAINDEFSDDYKILNHLMESIEAQFMARGCRLPPNSTMQSGRRQSPYATLGKWYQKHAARPKGPSSWKRSYEPAKGPPVRFETWPSPQDFSEAIQNPQFSLVDPDLNNSKPELTALGLPKVSTGAFASVFKLSNGENNFAVRCFNTKLTDQHVRYDAISRFVLADDLSYTVDFCYLSNGIKHNGTSYPVLKMGWVDGIPLDSYVGSHVRERSKIERLRSQFQTMVQELKNNGIAHGDLQHGNILVADENLYLVDYDGMFVPELEGLPSNELGHRNYQHPRREANHFGPYLDNFAAWLIDTSLLCLIEDPGLWKQFVGGDECLLFRHEDLVSPADSKLFQALRTHRSELIRCAATRLESFISKPVEDVPYLSDDGVPVYSAESLMRQAD